MSTLGAYYEATDNQLIDTEALSGLPAVDQFVQSAFQEVMSGQAGLPAASPLGIYVPWAVQNGGVDWQPEPNDSNLALYPISDDHLAAIKQLTFGTELPAVCVLTTTPVTLDAAAKAFDGTAYKFFQVEAIYRLADPKSLPTILFLYWADLRDPGDGGSGSASLASAANLMGGQLCYGLPSAKAPGQPNIPAIQFGTALAAQLAQTSPSPLAPVQPVVAAPPSAKPLAVVAVAALAALGGYYWWKKRKKES